MTLLLLAGSGEARQIAHGITDMGVDAVASYAGVTRAPHKIPLRTRTGGFGGQAGFEAYLQAENITAVLDATHPFAENITARTANVCTALGIPYLYHLRPAWQPEPGDNWMQIVKEEHAAAHIPKRAVVFLGTGRQTLHKFANLAGRHVICRQIDPPTGPFPFEGGEFLIGRPPFSVEFELDLFARFRIEWLVVKNAGGTASRTKLTAARVLGIPVLMIRRPDPPDAPIVDTVAGALTWVAARR